MQKYELMVILKPLLPEDVRKGAEGKIEKIINGVKGRVVGTDAWGKKHLAYPIKKHEEGYYIIFDLEIGTEAVKKIEEELRLVSEVLRFLLLKREKV